MKKYSLFVEKLINNSPDFLIIKENNKYYLSFDYFVNSLSDKSMPWLFKVYLDKNFNIIVEDKITDYIRDKYKESNLKVKDINGNMFLNKDLMEVILKELDNSNQVIYDEKEITFSLK